ncbi:MAG: ABC transporter ATP-binding protein [Propionibacteriaceae bacterium]|nr:ABC transporter ATP-binding protein [Propionibacteriaceae bacterium]
MNDFSCTFPTTGFILLLGESGSGKTTLFNVLAGLTEFESGSISVEMTKKTYNAWVDAEEMKQVCGYIMQDSFFVDYLTVLDNARLCSTDDARISDLFTQYALADCAKQYPGTLSGGERQRLAIVRMLLKEKPILFLDEPTAALDSENKIKLFELIKKLSAERLVIISSHDEEALRYADEVIDSFSGEHSFVAQPNVSNTKIAAAPLRALKPFFAQWLKSPGKERGAARRFSITLIIAVLLLSLADTAEHKEDSNMEYMLKLNQIVFVAPVGGTAEKEFLEAVYTDKKVTSLVLDYMMSAGYRDSLYRAAQGVDPDQGFDIDYENQAYTIPYDKKSYRLSGLIEYGTYFSAPEQIILSANMAKSLSMFPADLIGSTYEMKLYDATYDFEIVGIFATFTELNRQYGAASGIDTEVDCNVV